MDNTERRPLRAPGSRPLKYPKEERYAQERAYGYRQREAARRAGLNDYTGIFAKYEKKLRVQNRIMFLRTQDLTPEYHHAKRRHIEERLEMVAFGSMWEYTKVVNGKPIIDWEELARHELGVTISEIRFDKDTGQVTYIGRDNALGAISQLREMRGYKSADHVRIGIGSLQQMSDEDLLRIATQTVPALPAPDSEPIDAVDSVDDADRG
jgi:hypothetical protein